MGRPRTPIGTFGEVRYATSNGKVQARTRYRDWDGKLRQVQATGPTRTAAARALKAKLAHRVAVAPVDTTLTADSDFAELVDYWLDDLDLEGRLASSTRNSYERNMRTLVLPAFAELSLREIGVARCDSFLKHLARRSYNWARQARVVMRLAFALAVRHEILSRNPMDHVSRLRRPPSTPTALTPAEVDAVRAAIRFWEQGQSPTGPRPDGQLGLIVEVMLGTSARIEETLAIRRRDVDVTSLPPTIRLAGTVVGGRNSPFVRQDHLKTSRSRRTLALPSFCAEAVRKRLVSLQDRSLDALLFSNRDGGPLSPHNVRRQLRSAMDLAGIEGVTPHMIRRTVATEVNQQANVDLAAELLGHTDPKITIRHYIKRSELVNPVTADLLDNMFAPGSQRDEGRSQ